MDKNKAAEIIGILVANDYEPTIKRDNVNPSNFTITVVSNDGVSINTLKQFQDNNNNITAKARVIDLI